MIVLKHVLAAAVCIASVAAVEVTVSSSGGNDTGYGQTRYGFLHEDINNSGDGGIYAELVRNRAFQYSKKYPVNTDGYHSINAKLGIKMLKKPLSEALPASLRVTARGGASVAGFENEGYWGMDVKRQPYSGSFWVKGQYHGYFTASLQSNLTDAVFGSTKVKSKCGAGTEWVEHTYELVPTKDAPNSNNTLAITFQAANAPTGYLDFNLISLFPPTFKDRKNGLRIDLAEALYEFNPTVIRFPGGNMLEGNNNDTWWDWRNSIGPLKDRPGFPGVWGYQQTNGLGLMEYLEWAEDFGAEFVLAVYDGLSLNGDVTPRDKLQQFIDAALEEIEFVSGPADSTWGARRAELGHPEPFTLEYVEVGNEDWLAGGDLGWNSYAKYRFPLFQAAINAAYPDIEVLYSGSNWDSSSTGNFHPPKNPAIGDYHPYREPDALVEEFDRFDNVTVRHIVGEVAAVHVNNGTEWAGDLQPFPWWIGSVGEAVSMIGYERNADRVLGTFYAPVLRNMNRWQWSITLLQFAADPKLTTRSTSWYIWNLFAHHPITHILPVESHRSYGPIYYGAGLDEVRGGALVWKGAVYNTTNHRDIPISVAFEGVKAGTKAVLGMCTNPSGDPWAYNDPFTGVNVVETTSKVISANADGVFEFSMPELSVAVLDTDLSSLSLPTSKQKKRGLPGRPPAFRPNI